MNNSTINKVLDNIISDAITVAVGEIDEEVEIINNIEFSEDHKRKMEKIFSEVKRKETLKKLSKYSKRSAILFLVILATFAVTIFSVEAIRIKIFNFILEKIQVIQI